MEKKPYKYTEKWWLGLVVLFYLLYNIPGFPPYGEPVTALWHGALTIIPLWIVVYVGLFRLIRQRKLRDFKEINEYSRQNKNIS